ncbi:MAG: hypothetical protein ACTS8S_10420, partial [Giesbergeria sp.]
AQAATQTRSIASYQDAGEQLWLKKAGPRNGSGRYRLMGALATLLRLPLLTPVPNLGGPQAIATEARRLRELAALGIHVPELLAVQPDALLLRHLGVPGKPTPSLANEMRDAVPTGAAAVLALWQQGLAAIGQVHASGSCLSQAFARNLVRCADGQVGFIDFEDDPTSVLPLALCQARDALCFAHSSALALHEANALTTARPLWNSWLTQGAPAMQAAVAAGAARLGWLRHLPTDRRLGRDLQRARTAHDLLAPCSTP